MSGFQMSERKKRKLHGSAFKAKVGLEAVRGMMTANEIGQAHDVHPVQVSQSKKVIQEQAMLLFDGKRGPKAAVPDKTEALHSEIGRLKMALDWLKKSLG